MHKDAMIFSSFDLHRDVMILLNYIVFACSGVGKNKCSPQFRFQVGLTTVTNHGYLPIQPLGWTHSLDVLWVGTYILILLVTVCSHGEVVCG